MDNTHPITGHPATDNGLPMQFTTYNGGVSWVSVLLLGITFGSLLLGSIAAYHQIQSHREERKRHSQIEKDILDIKKRIGLPLTA